jgi:hypothetical protein
LWVLIGLGMNPRQAPIRLLVRRFNGGDCEAADGI